MDEFSSRKLFIEKVWKCCKKLLCQGHLERRDAFHLLSLLFSFYACEEDQYHKSRSGREEEFDIREDKVFWDEIKRGLVLDFYSFMIFLLYELCPFIPFSRPYLLCGLG